MTHSRERDHEFVFAVIIPSYGDFRKIQYKLARRLAKVVKLNFGDKIQVHIGSREGNLVQWTDDVWPNGE